MLCILSICLILVGPLFAHEFETKPTYQPNLFISLKKAPVKGRVEAARLMYKQHCRNMNEADAMRCIDEIKRIAVDLEDLPLECATFDMRSDYYSVNRGYNILSNTYFDQAIAFARKNHMQLETGIYQHRKANYYFLYKQNTAACRYFLLSEENLREVGFANVPGVSALFLETANFYYAMGDFENARLNLRYALKYDTKISRTSVNIINTIGLTYRNNGEYELAMNYFNNALKMAAATKDTVWMAIAGGNIGSIYFLQHRYDKALPLIRADYNQSLKYGQKLNAVIALLRIIRINIDHYKFKKAGMQLDTANRLLLNIDKKMLLQRAQYYDLKAILNEQLNNIPQAALYRDRAENLRDSLAKRDNMAAIERVRLQWITEKSRHEFNNLKKSAQINTFKQNTIIVVLILLIIITALVFNRQRLKANKDKELMALEKRRLDEELTNAIRALNGYTESLMQKNILIDKIKAELENVQVKFNSADVAASLDKMLQAHIMTDDSWAEFKRLFTRVHSTFFYNLRHKYANLSDTDVRLLALIKLKLNNREMAGMLGITVDGIKKAKQRLRKKMRLVEDEALEDVTDIL
ncbi:tetratricopeptide repeat protein [Mucilaginibacter sp. 14171R-50]|uniref:tetratricopeptide repeat protein n=1 Tax=Mucilaginibacter sp. 14171R-50 TaxID=2703789 RepID=UPI00138C220B|nr:tetratricopeptide repeat protein [Mucilaginibacter sp. 14171R-50]QHS54736.1 tetratricopeptide repeat protein [Mucilaginibacter sp. 14171R-50]